MLRRNRRISRFCKACKVCKGVYRYFTGFTSFTRKYKKPVIASGSVAIARKRVDDMRSSLVLKPQVGTLAVARGGADIIIGFTINK